LWDAAYARKVSNYGNERGSPRFFPRWARRRVDSI
jgi:hypothetical protein